MSNMLFAGAARQLINPPLGIGKIGTRLFGDPIQAVESDLTATALVLANRETKIVILALDLCTVATATANQLRGQVAQALGIPMSHVLLNLSHNHSAPALPGYMPDDFEPQFKKEYLRKLERWLVHVAQAADRNAQPARMGVGWGESHIGVYRREFRDGHDVLGEVPDHPIDASVGVIRVDDLDGNPLATLFRYSCHPVTVGPRSMVASTDFPGPAREVLETNLGGLALFLQGCGGNINPRVGIGYEVDCRDTKKRIGLELGGEALRVAARIRTNTRAGGRRPLGSVPNILFTPWEAVGEGETCTYLGAVEETVALDFVELPSLAEAKAIQERWTKILAERRARDAQEWEIRLAVKMVRWTQALVESAAQEHPTFSLNLQAIRVNDVVLTGMNVETFFETGLTIREKSPFRDTFVLGYTNGSTSYLPRAEDYPEGGWKLDGSYAVPDMLFQFYNVPVAFKPDAEQRAIDGTLKLLKQLSI